MSFGINISIEGFEELNESWKRESIHMQQDLGHCVQEAADAGIAEMQRNHPYQDQTYKLSGGMYTTPVQVGARVIRCDIKFMAKYARWVNDGTRYAKPYPFIPQGKRVAQEKLDLCVHQALARFWARVG